MTTADDDDASVHAAPREPGLPIAKAIGSKRLIGAIVLMPVIAVAAALAIILYARANPKAAPPPRAQTLVLPPGGRVVETVSDARHIIVRIEAPGGGEIAVYDIASGERLRTIKIEGP